MVHKEKKRNFKSKPSFCKHLKKKRNFGTRLPPLNPPSMKINGDLIKRYVLNKMLQSSLFSCPELIGTLKTIHQSNYKLMCSV